MQVGQKVGDESLLAAFVLKTPLPDLTKLAKSNEGEYLAGRVCAVLTFGRSPACQRHVDHVDAYMRRYGLNSTTRKVRNPLQLVERQFDEINATNLVNRSGS